MRTKARTPALQRSHFTPYGRPKRTSGAAYDGVPQSVTRQFGVISFLLKPKSPSLKTRSSPEDETRTFSGLISLKYVEKQENA